MTAAIDPGLTLGAPLEFWNRWLADPGWWQNGYRNQLDALNRIGRDTLEIQRQYLRMMTAPAVQAGLAPDWVEVVMNAAETGLEIQVETLNRCVEAVKALGANGQLAEIEQAEAQVAEELAPTPADRRGR